MTEPKWDDADALAAELAGFYGDGVGTPTRAQWREVIAADPGGPICVVNFVKLRDEARYPTGVDEAPASGVQAFMRYGAGSAPRIHAVGGTMTFAGRQERTFIGAEEDWDVVVTATYPDRRAFVRLFLDPAYREAFRHRRAAVDRYRAVIAAA
ncbi:MAG: DUF1330 domain-containing protein [Pseudomonadota bacterium]